MESEIQLPLPPSATTTEQALADLAGATLAAVSLMLDYEGDRSTPWGKTLLVALAQWRGTGLVQAEAEIVSETIIEGYLTYLTERK